MPNEVQLKSTTEYSFHSSAYSPTGNNDLSSGTPTVVDLTLDEGATGLADAAAVNSDQVDLGANRPTSFLVTAAIEWFSAPTSGLTVSFYWSASANSGVGVGNPGFPDGVDGLYAGHGTASVIEAVKQMIYIGSMVCSDVNGVQIATIGLLNPVLRYGQLIVFNNSGATLCGTDDIESSVLFSGLVDEIQ
jgi:hypothetical protein